MSEEAIENFFLEIENLIKLQLQDKIQNQPDIEKKFKEGKKLINELEDDNEEQYGFFKYKYYITYANYLEKSGEVDRANKQKREAKRYEEDFFKKSSERLNTYKAEPRLFRKATLGDDINSNPKQENIQEALEKELEKIQNILNDKIIESIKETFKQFDNVPKTFEDYKNIVAYEAILYKLADNVISESLINLEEPDTSQNSKINKEDKKQKISSLKDLKSLASKAAYSKRLAFIFHVLNSPDKEEILFRNISFTEEGINKRFKELALYFHSDRTNQPDTPVSLKEKHKSLGSEIFSFALEFKESLLNDLDEILKAEGNVSFHEKKANNLWKITIDYRNAAKEQWNKLNVLKKDDIKENSPDELKRLSIENGILSYQEYRAACKIADKAKQLKKQVELRGHMALCLYISNKFVEAQLYALSAIQLQLRNSQKVTQQELIRTKKIFDKVKGGDDTADSTEEVPKLTTEIKLSSNYDDDNKLALVKTVDQEISLFDKMAIERSINNDMTKIGTELMLRADRQLVRYQVPKEMILHAEKRAFKHKLAGGVVVGGGMVTGVVATIAAIIDISEAVLVVGVGSIGGPIGLVCGLATLGLGIWGGHRLWKKGSLLYKEPEIREKLNKILSEALGAYDKGEHQKFFEILSTEEYIEGESLLKLKEHEDHINPQDIIATLLKHGFRSDGIAYLLILLGEILSSGKIKIKGKTSKDLKAIAMDAFEGALSKKLETEAKKLDGRIHELQKKYPIKSYFNKFIDFLSLKEYSDMAQEYKDDSQEMPFKARLEEMRNIARINRAIFDIIDAGEEEIERAVKTIKEIQDSINCNYQFVNAAKWRYEVLEDLIWVISGDEPPKGSPEELPKFSLITYIDNEYLSFLNEQLQQATSKQEKVHLYNRIAALHEQLAEKEENINRLESLYRWKVAQKNYEKAREMDSKNLDSSIGFAKCLLKLFKYTQIIELYNTCPDIISLSEYWRLRSIAYCKKIDYGNARVNIIEALKLDNKNNLAEKQMLFLKKISKENTIKWRINRYEKGINKVDCLKNSDSNKCPVYNILSIDGGGVCGVLPALWLSEIEHRTHRPISHLFNMMAGTSTGGIIAAGLSVPSWRKTLDIDPIYTYSDSEPMFSALDLLNLYQDKSKELFSNNNSWSLLRPKYTENDRSLLFEEYFGKACLNKALTELVIPAVNENNLMQTHLFTRYDARKFVSKNDTFVDTLMATTAAPTFFPPHEIEGKGTFLDGALHINSPAMAAYEKSIQYNVEKEKISVLSLGTGSYIPDPLNPDQYRGQLFWAQNLHKVVLPQQEGNTDNQMCSILGNRYQRWQVWLEEPIEFDDHESIPNLLELGHQYIEELDTSDENPINRLVESFDKVL